MGLGAVNVQRKAKYVIAETFLLGFNTLIVWCSDHPFKYDLKLPFDPSKICTFTKYSKVQLSMRLSLKNKGVL
jgi:hypothetical protein